MAGLVASLLTGCGGESRETITFAFAKREAIPFMQELVAEYNSSQDEVRVVMDTSTTEVRSASFVRGNPADITLANYNTEMSRFVEACAMSDLSDTPEADRIQDDLWPLMDEYAVCDDTVSALPYSIMGASVIYNKEIFAEHGLDVPTTWDELIEVSDTLKGAEVDPFYATWQEDWSIGQGWFDYAAGGSLDTSAFFAELQEEGADVGPDAAVSFEKDMVEPVDQMMFLVDNYINADAGSRTYADGNLAMAQGKAAMYLQGPWAFSEIAKSNPDLDLGTFPLPMTNDPEDLKIRANVDLAAWIPEASEHKEEARDFLSFLYEPETILAYNESQLGFTPTTEAPMPSDPRIQGMVSSYEDGQFYQGLSVLIPRTIPINNYLQGIVLGENAESRLRIIDADFSRLARRA